MGPAPLTSVFQDNLQASASTAELTLDKATDGGIWVEYSASWSRTTNTLRITSSDGTANRAGGFAIGIGGVGSERVVMEIPAPDYDARSLYGVEVPITIRAGERVSIRLETAAAAAFSINLFGYFNPKARTDLRHSDAMGVVSRTSVTVVDPGATLNTKGAWVEIDATTANNYKAILLRFCNQNSTDTATVNCLVDVGVGASGSEIAILSDLWVVRSGRHMSPSNKWFFIPAQINSGVRLAVRCQADSDVVGVRDQMGAAIIGLY